MDLRELAKVAAEKCNGVAIVMASGIVGVTDGRDKMTAYILHALETVVGESKSDARMMGDWEAAMIDRLNELARENRKYFEEAENGEQGANLIREIHGQFNVLRMERDQLKAQLEQARKDGALRDALGWLLTFVGQGEEQKFAEWVYQNTPAKSTTSVAELEKLIHECLSKCWTALADTTRQAGQKEL